MTLTMRCLIGLLLAGAASLPAQEESGRALIGAARKRAQDGRGLKGEELAVVLRDCVRILAMVPEKFPEDRSAVARAWLEIGHAHRRMGSSPAALEAYGKAAAIPEEPSVVVDALHGLATVYRKEKRREEAETALRSVIDDHPGQPRSRADAFLRLAGLQRDRKAFDEAAATLERCLEDHGDLWRCAVDALDDLVGLKLRQKDPAGARALLTTKEAQLRARFAGTADEERLEAALAKMDSRARLAKAEAPPGGG